MTREQRLRQRRQEQKALQFQAESRPFVKWPRHYAFEILELPPAQQAAALNACPVDWRDLIADHVRILGPKLERQRQRELYGELTGRR